jgi:TM2 domain-containing membrane protein YozV
MSSAAMSMETAPRRSRVIAGLLSLIAPGVGQLYAGRPRRGVALFAMLVAIQLMLLAVAFLLPASYAAIMSYAALVAIVCLGAFLFVLVDAVRLARRADGSPTVCRWYVCAAAVVAVWLVFIAMSTLSDVVKPHLPWRMFNLPSTSMQPTLRLGERLLGDMSYFKQHAPSRGDVIIYRLPKDPSTLYVKRVVALAGTRSCFAAAARSSTARRQPSPMPTSATRRRSTTIRLHSPCRRTTCSWSATIAPTARTAAWRANTGRCRSRTSSAVPPRSSGRTSPTARAFGWARRTGDALAARRSRRYDAWRSFGRSSAPRRPSRIASARAIENARVSAWNALVFHFIM